MGPKHYLAAGAFAVGVTAGFGLATGVFEPSAFCFEDQVARMSRCVSLEAGVLT